MALPAITVSNPLSSWANKVNQHSESQRLSNSNDFVVKHTSKGTHISLKTRHKYGFHGMRYLGDFNYLRAYDISDVVRVNAQTIYPDVQGVVIPVQPGVWVCIKPIPDLEFGERLRETAADFNGIERYMRSTAVNYSPVYPEPADPMYKYWELLVPWSVCT